LQPTSFFIGSTPRLAEDVVRLVPVFPPARARKTGAVIHQNDWVTSVGGYNGSVRQPHHHLRALCGCGHGGGEPVSLGRRAPPI